MAETIVVAGALAQKPRRGGHTWAILQYLLGFKRLGWQVLFLDRLEPSMSVDGAGRPCAVEHSLNLEYLGRVMEQFGLEDAFSVLDGSGQPVLGLSRRDVLERTRRSAFLLNVMGYLQDEEILGCAPRRVFLDIDPGFGQMWRELGLHDPFSGHDEYVTVGENIGQPDCTIPTGGLQWLTTRPPVVLEHWPAQPVANGAFTSVIRWRGAYGPISYQGKTYGLRVHEFRKFVDLPRRSGRSFELALDIHPAESTDLELLTAHGWRLVDPIVAAGDPCSYQTYIQQSMAEFAVAKNMYVECRSGWFSDRSVCYLASGRPVLFQDTGLGHLLPVGEGLLTFSEPEEALSALEELCRDYTRHARTARSLAEEYFDSDRVLSTLLARLGLT